MTKTRNSNSGRLFGLLALAILWEGGARMLGKPMLVPLSDALFAAAHLLADGSLIEHAAVSLVRVSLGFGVAAIAGVSLGLAMVRWRAVDAALSPLVDMVRPVAALTIFPLIILLLGIGLAGKVFVIFWTAWPACLLNTVQGLRAVDASVLEAARLDGAQEGQLLRFISFPLALPTTMTGLRIGLSGGWISLVAAEMLGAKSGLGWAVMAYANTFHFAEMYAAILTIAAIGLAMNLLLSWVQERIHPESHQMALFDFRALFDWRK